MTDVNPEVPNAPEEEVAVLPATPTPPPGQDVVAPPVVEGGQPMGSEGSVTPEQDPNAGDDYYAS